MLFSPASLGAGFAVRLFAGDWPGRLPVAVEPDCRVFSEAGFAVRLFAGDWPARLPADVEPGC